MKVDLRRHWIPLFICEISLLKILWCRCLQGPFTQSPFLMIQFLVPKTGSRRSDGPISRFRSCGENVGRSFVVVHMIRFLELTKNLQFGAKTIMENLSVSFIIQGSVRWKLSMFYFHPFFFKITDPFDRRSILMCSHDPFFGTNKNRILKNGSPERAFRVWFHKVAIIWRVTHMHITYFKFTASWIYALNSV